MTEIQNLEPTPTDDFQVSSKPYNPGYHVSKVPLNYDAQVQLSAVLRVIYPRVRSTPKLIVEATARLCQRWRILATKLAAANWVPMAGSERKSQLSNALGCPPAFVMTFEKSHKAKAKKKNPGCCHLRQLCPFCWAREVRRYWLKIEPAFFPRLKRKTPSRVRPVDTGPLTEKSPPFTLRVKDGETIARSPYDLVYRVFTFIVPLHVEQSVTNVMVIEDGVSKLVPNAVIMKRGLSLWFDSRFYGRPDARIHRLHECRAILKAAGPTGGMLESIRYQRIDDKTGQSWWEVQVRQLILAADGDALSKQLNSQATGELKQHIVLHKPNRYILAKWMGKTLQYPRFILMPDTPIERVVEYLNVRRSRRLVASFGRFRIRTPK